jgi:hypothetical protein
MASVAPTHEVWNSLEVVKLIFSLLTPLALAFLARFIDRASRRYEDRRWVNQRVIEKRLEIYDELAPMLNDVLCYFTFVGCWKDFDPPAIVKMKRDLDRKIHLAKPLFPAAFSSACQMFVRECFTSFGGLWGSDTKLRTTIAGRMEAHPRPWDPNWANHFDDESTKPERVQKLYTNIMREFTASLGELEFTPSSMLTRLPANVREDAMK